MANTGPDTNDSHFSIMVEKAPHLDGHYTIFGDTIEGFEVINSLDQHAGLTGECGSVQHSKMLYARAEISTESEPILHAHVLRN